MKVFYDPEGDWVDKPTTAYRKHGQIWSQEDLRLLHQYVVDGYSLNNICEALGRSRSGVLPKAASLGLTETNPETGVVTIKAALEESRTPLSDRKTTELILSTFSRTLLNPSEQVLAKATILDNSINWPSTTHPILTSGEMVMSNKPTEEIKMEPKKLPIEVKTYVYGVDVADLTDAQLIVAIRKVTAEIKALEDLQADSAKVRTMVENLERDKVSLIGILDSKL